MAAAEPNAGRQVFGPVAFGGDHRDAEGAGRGSVGVARWQGFAEPAGVEYVLDGAANTVDVQEEDCHMEDALFVHQGKEDLESDLGKKLMELFMVIVSFAESLPKSTFICRWIDHQWIRSRIVRCGHVPGVESKFGVGLEAGGSS